MKRASFTRMAIPSRFERPDFRAKVKTVILDPPAPPAMAEKGARSVARIRPSKHGRQMSGAETVDSGFLDQRSDPHRKGFDRERLGDHFHPGRKKGGRHGRVVRIASDEKHL